METPKLYTLGEEDTAPVVNGVQGTLNTGAFEGDPRGLNSTDLQFLRQNSGQAATGDNSFIAAGENNSIMGHHSACFGLGHYIEGSYAHATGVGHVISGDASAAEGDGNTVTGYGSHAEGAMHQCDGEFSHTGGLAARSYNNFQQVLAGGGFSYPGGVGEAQVSRIVARLQAEDVGPFELAVGDGQPVVLLEKRMNLFRIRLVATSGDLSDGAAWDLTGLIKRGATAASTALVGSIIKTVIACTNPLWDVEITADTVQGALSIRVRGEYSRLIRWVACIEMVEAGGVL